MNIAVYLPIIQTAIELGLICSLTVLALFLSYSMLNVCDLSTDGCFTLGAAVGAVIAISGHPYLSIIGAIAAGMLSGFITSFLQTRMGINSLLSGIIMNTALYSINIFIMSGSSLLNMNKTVTVFTIVKDALSDTPVSSYFKIVVSLLFVTLIILFLSFFLKTKLGLSIRATGNNPSMVKSSSINPVYTTMIGLSIANSFTALSGCLLAQSQKSVSIDIGSGMLTIALASLLIGTSFLKKTNITLRAVSGVLGAIIFRFVYSLALRINMPAYMLKLISSIIVILAISIPYLKSKASDYKRVQKHRKEVENA